jgi:hypothetical protein
MKKTLSFMIFWLILGLYSVLGQNIPVYPIPSYNVKVDGYVDFSQQHTVLKNNSKQKKDVIIHLKSGSTENTGCQATVWIYSLDQTSILGPFIMNCGETLVVGIDDREWGVLVNSEDDVIIDVWIE